MLRDREMIRSFLSLIKAARSVSLFTKPRYENMGTAVFSILGYCGFPDLTGHDTLSCSLNGSFWQLVHRGLDSRGFSSLGPFLPLCSSSIPLSFPHSLSHFIRQQ